MNRHRATVFLLCIWVLLFYRTVQAATLTEFMGGYDNELLQWAATIALLGGGVRTILSLESDKRVILDIVKTAMWDAAKALVAGMLIFVLIQAVRSSGAAIPNEIRFLAVLAAGWSRIAAVDWFVNAGKDWLEARKVQFVSKTDNKTDDPK